MGTIILMVLIICFPDKPSQPQVIYSSYSAVQDCSDALKITVNQEIQDGHIIVDGGCYQLNLEGGTPA